MVSCCRKDAIMYTYYVDSVNGIVDGDTIDVSIDLGFHLFYRTRVRLAGVDTPESRTTDLVEKSFGLRAKHWLETQLHAAEHVTIRTELSASEEKYGRVLGTVWVGDRCLNTLLLEKKLAWPYDGGTKVKDFSALAPLDHDVV